MKKPRSGKVNRAWLADHMNDPYVKQAQKDGYRSRAAYKLQELDSEFSLFRAGQCVVDLGAAPGAWSQYLRKQLGAGGRIVALDLLPLEPLPDVEFIQGDFRQAHVLQQLSEALAGRLVDVVVSDMAPNLSGIASADAARMADLLELALEFSLSHLQPAGALVAKLFHGSGYSQLIQRLKTHFVSVKAHKPKASRARSAETFVVAQRLKKT